MDHRRFLALLGSTTALAGCQFADGPAPGTSTETDAGGETTASPTVTDSPTASGSPTETTPDPLAIGEPYHTDAGETRRVQDVHLRRSLFDLPHPDAARPIAPTDTQFVFVTIDMSDVDDGAPPTWSFRLRYDNRTVTGQSSVADAPIDTALSIVNDDVEPTPALALDQDYDSASVGFEVPLDVEPECVIVEWTNHGETARWEWGADLVAALGRPPSFRVTSIDHPETFVCGEPFDVAVTIANDGGRTEDFRAIFPAVEPIATGQTRPVAESVPAGGTAIWNGTREFPPPLSGQECDADVDAATFELDWGVDARRITIPRES